MHFVPFLFIVSIVFTSASNIESSPKNVLNDIFSHIQRECSLHFQHSACESLLLQSQKYEALFAAVETCPRDEREGAKLMGQRWHQLWETLDDRVKPLVKDLIVKFREKPELFFHERLDVTNEAFQHGNGDQGIQEREEMSAIRTQISQLMSAIAQQFPFNKISLRYQPHLMARSDRTEEKKNLVDALGVLIFYLPFLSLLIFPGYAMVDVMIQGISALPSFYGFGKILLGLVFGLCSPIGINLLYFQRLFGKIGSKNR